MANDQLAVNTIRVLAVSLHPSNPTRLRCPRSRPYGIGGETDPAMELCLQSWC